MCPSIITILLYDIDYSRTGVNVLLALSHSWNTAINYNTRYSSINTVIVDINTYSSFDLFFV